MSKFVTTMTIYDVDHYTDDERDMIIDSYLPHERDARSKGIPTMGSGAIFPIAEDEITVKPFEIPTYYRRICGVDFGWDHPAAGTWLAHDPDTDIIYVTDTYKMRQTLIPIIASGIKSRGNWIPIAWPHDGLQVKDAMHGTQLAKQYKAEGVNMLHKHAQFKRDSRSENQGSIVSVEAGIQEMLSRMVTGKWKVFSNCEQWLEEFRMYHRENGVIVKKMDDVLDSSRYALMMLRYAKVLQVSNHSQTSQAWQPADKAMGY